MLKLFRQRKRVIKWVLWGIVLVVGFTMVITLVPGVGGGYGPGIDSPDVVATVGKQAITSQEVLRRVARLQAFEGAANPLFRRFVGEQVIEDLIFMQMVEKETEHLGVQVTPEEVSARIREMQIFAPEGKFVGTAEYQRLVQQQFRATVAEFEADVRASELGRKLYQLLTDGLRVSEAEVEQEFRARNEKVAVEYALFKPRVLEAELQPSEDELRAYFNANRDRYQLPERRRVRYARVDFDWVAQRAPVTPEELRNYYERNRESYRVPEQVQFRHILLRFPEGATEEQKEELRQKARRVHAELVREKDFAALAKQHSEDKSTAEKGGEVGWVQRGQVVPALEAVLFSLAQGALSQPIEVGYGIHLVRVADHQQERLKPLEEVRSEIEAVLRPQKNQQQAFRVAQEIAQAVRGGLPAGRAGKTLTTAAEAAGLQVEESALFGLTDSLLEFAGTTAVQEAAFRLRPGEVSEPVSVGTGYAVVELLEVAPAHRAEFAEVRDPLERAFRQERSGQLAQQRAQGLADAAKKSGELRAAARATKAEVKLSGLFTRADSVPELGLAREFAGAVFPLPVGGVAGPLRVGVNWAVLRVAARQEADLRQLEQQRGLLAAQLLAAKRQMTFQLFREGLKRRLAEGGELRLNQRAIERILGTS